MSASGVITSTDLAVIHENAKTLFEKYQNDLRKAKLPEELTIQQISNWEKHASTRQFTLKDRLTAIKSGEPSLKDAFENNWITIFQDIYEQYNHVHSSKLKSTRNEHSAIKWNIRVGIHSGSVVSGIVGKKKFTFDIWGDTVNIASRLESECAIREINVSAYTHDLSKDKYKARYRGKIDAKGKGEIDMYYINY